MSKTILLVDDDQRLRDLLKDYLKEKDFKVYTSQDFIEAKEIVNFLGTQRVYDLKTGFQSNHISSRNTGDWKKKLDKSEIEILNKEFKNWLKEFEYE